MNSNLNIFNIDHNLSNLKKGKCLISEPFSPDSYFGRSVVLITEHNKKDGSIGYILNKPVKIKINELFPDFPEFGAQCYIGGPVSPETIHYIHNRIDILPESNHVFGDIYWGGDFDILKDLISSKMIHENEIKFFLGYSGWAPEQLTQEIEDKYWIVSDIEAKSILKKQPDIWKELLNKKGDAYSLWANAPANPGMN